MIYGGSDFQWVEDAINSYSEKQTSPPHASDNVLYGTFAERESVGSYARTILRNGATIQAVVFFNFKRKKKNQKIETTISQCCGELHAKLHKVVRNHKLLVPKYTARLVEILKVTESLAQLQLGRLDDPKTLSCFFGQFLASVLKTLAINESNGFGSIHIVSTDRSQMSLEAAIPQSMNKGQVQSLSAGMGIVPWVASQKRAILIDDLHESAYKPLFHSLDERETHTETRSELAVPMFLGDEVLGVLNIESFQPNVFQSADVKALLYAANQAAISYELCRQASVASTINSMLDELLRACQDGDRHSGSALRNIAKILESYAKADMCDIWKVSMNTFESAGASNDSINTTVPPRRDGWSAYIARNVKSVWIKSIRSSEDFQSFAWEDSGAWIETDENAPQRLHESLKGMKVSCEMGVPIVVGERVVGVAWLKYEVEREHLPSKQDVADIRRMVSSVGLVLGVVFSHERELERKRSELEVRVSEFQKSLFSKNLVSEQSVVEIAVVSESLGASIGGDFYGWMFLDDDCGRLAVVIGDGEGHGLEGAFQMLPLWTAWRLLSSERTTSTNYVLQNMNRVAIDMDVKGTALYFIVDTQSGRRCILSGSNAGHPPLIRINRSAENDNFPPPVKGQAIDTNASMLGVPLPSPLGEAITECESDDVLIAFTDGIQDAGEKSSDGIAYSRHGIVTAALPVLGGTAEDIAVAVFEGARKYGFHDDATVLVVKLKKATR